MTRTITTTDVTLELENELEAAELKGRILDLQEEEMDLLDSMSREDWNGEESDLTMDHYECDISLVRKERQKLQRRFELLTA